MNLQNRKTRIFLGVLGAAALILLGLYVFAPQQSVRPVKPLKISAQLLEIRPRDYQVQIQSFGRVQPRITSKLVAQVGGRIVRINPNFRPGGHFENGNALAWVEDDDYRHAVTVARSQLARARSELSVEEARFAQAQRDWERLGSNQEASPLTLREPQLKRARSELAATEAQLAMARLNLKRTVIAAPFSGRVRKQFVDVGQVVSPGTMLAEIYANDNLEIRLPILFRDIAFLPRIATVADDEPGTPENGQQDSASRVLPPQVRFSHSDTPDRQWPGAVVRAEAGLEESSYQYHLVARIPIESQPPVVGQYLDAIITGKTIRSAVVIPATALYRDSYVWVADADRRLERRRVETLWRNDTDVVVKSGLSGGEVIVLTRLGYVLEGTPIEESPSS